MANYSELEKNSKTYKKQRGSYLSNSGNQRALIFKMSAMGSFNEIDKNSNENGRNGIIIERDEIQECDPILK